MAEGAWTASERTKVLAALDEAISAIQSQPLNQDLLRQGWTSETVGRLCGWFTSHIFASFFSRRVDGRSDLSGRLLSASTRHPVLEDLGWGVSTTGGPDFGVNLEAVGAGSFAFGFGDRFAVFVSELVELSFSPTCRDPVMRTAETEQSAELWCLPSTMTSR